VPCAVRYWRYPPQAVYAAVSSAVVDVLAEVRALVPGAIPHLSNLIRTMMPTANHGGDYMCCGVTCEVILAKQSGSGCAKAKSSQVHASQREPARFCDLELESRVRKNLEQKSTNALT